METKSKHYGLGYTMQSIVCELIPFIATAWEAVGLGGLALPVEDAGPSVAHSAAPAALARPALQS